MPAAYHSHLTAYTTATAMLMQIRHASRNFTTVGIFFLSKILYIASG